MDARDGRAFAWIGAEPVWIRGCPRSRDAARPRPPLGVVTALAGKPGARPMEAIAGWPAVKGVCTCAARPKAQERRARLPLIGVEAEHHRAGVLLLGEAHEERRDEAPEGREDALCVGVARGRAGFSVVP